MNRRQVLAAALLVTLGLAGCGGSDDGAASTTTTESTTATEPATSQPADTATSSTAPPDPESSLAVSDKMSVGGQQQELAVGDVRLWISNQSFDDDTVEITVHVDGIEVVSDSFLVEGQHNWVAFDIAGLEPGEHDLVATSDTGADLETSFTLPAEESRWLVVDYWYSEGGAGGGEPDGRFFTFNESDAPVGFA